jgi:hypothetical protein
MERIRADTSIAGSAIAGRFASDKIGGDQCVTSKQSSISRGRKRLRVAWT